MRHTGSPKKVVFHPHLVDILDILNRNIIENHVANHASKAYKFSHFLPYSTPAQSQQSFERGGINSLSSPFVDSDMWSKIQVLEDEYQYLHDLDIDIVPQDDPYLDIAPIPNQNTKWYERLIEAIGNEVGDPNDRRRMRSQYHNEHVSLSHIASLPIEWCNKLPKRCYLMMKIDPQFGPLMKKMDHSIHPLEIRGERNIQQISEEDV